MEITILEIANPPRRKLYLDPRSGDAVVFGEDELAVIPNYRADTRELAAARRYRVDETVFYQLRDSARLLSEARAGVVVQNRRLQEALRHLRDSD